MPASYELGDPSTSGGGSRPRPAYEQPVHERVQRRLVYTEDELRLAHSDALQQGRPMTAVLGANIYLSRGCMTLSSPGFTIDGGRNVIRVGHEADCLFVLAADNITLRDFDIDTDAAAASLFVVMKCTSVINWLRISGIRVFTSTSTQRQRSFLVTSGSGALFAPRLDDITFDTAENDYSDAPISVVSDNGVFTRFYFEGAALGGGLELLAGSDSNIFSENMIGGDIDTSAGTNSVIDSNIIEGTTTSDATDTVGDND